MSSAEHFRELVLEMRRQGTPADGPELRRLGELVQELDDLAAEFGPRVEPTQEQLDGRAPWFQVDQLVAHEQFDLLQAGVLDAIDREYARYWSPIRKRQRRRRRLARLVSWAVGGLVLLLLLALAVFVFWIFTHPGMRLIERDIRRVIGDLTDVLGWAIAIALYAGLLIPGCYGVDRAYRWTYRRIAGENPPAKRP